MYEELVVRLRKRAVNLKEKFSRNAELLSELMQAADAIEELSLVLESYRNRMRVGCDWIPVTERLPKYGERVLVFGGVTMYVAYYDKNRFGCESWHKLNSKSHYCNPTHWMPLPEPPKEEGE